MACIPMRAAMQPPLKFSARNPAHARRICLVRRRRDRPHIPPPGGIAGEGHLDAATFVIDMRVVHELQGWVRPGRCTEDQCMDHRVRRDFFCRRTIVRLVGIEKLHRCVVPGVLAGRHARAGLRLATLMSVRFRRLIAHATGKRHDRDEQQRRDRTKDRGNTHQTSYSTRRSVVNAAIRTSHLPRLRPRRT